MRTRATILEALLALVRTGALNPTAAEIAREAGVSLRSISQHFPTRGELYGAAVEQQFFGEGCFTGVGVGNNGQRTPPGGFVLGAHGTL